MGLGLGFGLGLGLANPNPNPNPKPNPTPNPNPDQLMAERMKILPYLSHGANFLMAKVRVRPKP